VIGLSYWFGTTLLVSLFSKLIDTQVFIGLIVCVGFRIWIENVLIHYVSLCLCPTYLI
jgi:hypothetical protein